MRPIFGSSSSTSCPACLTALGGDGGCACACHSRTRRRLSNTTNSKHVRGGSELFLWHLEQRDRAHLQRLHKIRRLPRLYPWHKSNSLRHPFSLRPDAIHALSHQPYDPKHVLLEAV